MTDCLYSPQDAAFRNMLTEWVRGNLDPHVREKSMRFQVANRPEHMAFWQKLAAENWMVPNWPAEYGGQPWTPVQQHIFEEVMVMEGAPDLAAAGVKMIGPIIIAFGTDAQKQRFLPGIRNGTEWWAQGFSEPEAGSDLASLRTTADLDGSRWLLNGQKIWCSMGNWADYLFVLARTERDAAIPQAGLSMFLVDAHSPGIDIRPIKMVDGHDFTNEIFFDNVELPFDALVGERGQGWTYAKFLLSNERTGLIRTGLIKLLAQQLHHLAQVEREDGCLLLHQPVFRFDMAAVLVEARALEISTFRLLVDPKASEEIGVMPSLLKIKSASIIQQLSQLMIRTLGPSALPQLQYLRDDFEWAVPLHADNIALNKIDVGKASIYGGSSEIQRNIVAKAALSL